MTDDKLHVVGEPDRTKMTTEELDAQNNERVGDLLGGRYGPVAIQPGLFEQLKLITYMEEMLNFWSSQALSKAKRVYAERAADTLDRFEAEVRRGALTRGGPMPPLHGIDGGKD